jgi:hypothetical protein
LTGGPAFHWTDLRHFLGVTSAASLLGVKECGRKDLTYHDWLEHAFGHEVRFQQAAWFFDHDRDLWDPEPAVALAYLTRLFEAAEPLIFAYSDSQIPQGLIYLVNTSASGDNGWFYATAAPIEDRVRCVEAVALRNCSSCAVALICRI